MHTNIIKDIANTENGIEATRIIKSCVHCGFCLATCPTYKLLNDERDSPRGRIYLVKSMLEGNDFSANSIKHLDRCLTCKSCETTCPSGVEYTKLIDIGRELFEQKRALWQKIYRYALRKFLTTPLLFNPIGMFFKHSQITTKTLKPQQKKTTILLLNGCVQNILAPNINHNIKNILAKLNYKCIESAQSHCCGAIDQHLSASAAAKKKIKRNIDKWYELLNSGIEHILSSASGCGVMIKNYSTMFLKDSIYYKKALLVVSKTQDIAQFLATQDLTKFNTKKVNICYHEPCTMQHGQQLGGLVESILTKLGYKLTAVKDSHLCCGSAGTYSILQKKLSQKLKTEKLKNLQATNPQIIVTSNIGCLMHLQKGNKTPVKHWVELLETE